jgi:hypothetical protein
VRSPGDRGGFTDSRAPQSRLEEEQKKAWEEQKKQRTYEGMYTEEAFAEREAWSDDDFM